MLKKSTDTAHVKTGSIMADRAKKRLLRAASRDDNTLFVQHNNSLAGYDENDVKERRHEFGVNKITRYSISTMITISGFLRSNVMKRKHFLALALFAAITGNLYALDITEPFSTGILTDFEGYFGRTFPKEGNQKNFSEFIIGGGFTENLSYFFSGSAASDFKSIESVGLNFIWRFISTEGFTACLTPHAAFITNDGENTYYDIMGDIHIEPVKNRVYHLGANIQLHLSALRVIQPYMEAGYSYTQSRKEPDDHSWAIPLHFGIMVPVGETGIELFGQFAVEPCKHGTWDSIERYAAGGINYQIIENLELITEGGYEFTNREALISAGFIFAL